MGSSPDSESRTGHVVFYDGYCVLCSKSIDFILSRDILAAFQFASLQSDFAQRAFPERGYPIANTKNLSNTVYLQHNDIK
jgi:predicted DCC family thiol-disulfide oxidoreductase YuxK